MHNTIKFTHSSGSLYCYAVNGAKMAVNYSTHLRIKFISQGRILNRVVAPLVFRVGKGYKVISYT